MFNYRLGRVDDYNKKCLTVDFILANLREITFMDFIHYEIKKNNTIRNVVMKLESFATIQSSVF